MAKKTKTVYFTGTCIASYDGYIEVPEDTKQGELADYINKHINDSPADNLLFLEELSDDYILWEDIKNPFDFKE